jgi:hypothetical protein
MQHDRRQTGAGAAPLGFLHIGIFRSVVTNLTASLAPSI